MGTAAAIAAPGKGILAVDESTKTIGKRLESIGVENTEEARQAYRGLLFTADGVGKYISGAILYEETLFQSHANGTPFVDCLKKIGVIPGIKVDTGPQPLPGGHPVETWCTGLDGLKERAAAYYAQGARFAKAVQESGLVPIVEPEILMVVTIILIALLKSKRKFFLLYTKLLLTTVFSLKVPY